MRDPMPTIAGEWEEFARDCLPDWPPKRLEHLKEMFYTGFFSMLTIALEINGTDGSKRDKARLLKRYYDEHRSSRTA